MELRPHINHHELVPCKGGRIHTVELYRKVRLACRDGMSERAAARHFGVSRQSVRKMLEFSGPPGYRRKAPVRRPKLDGFASRCGVLAVRCP